MNIMDQLRHALRNCGRSRADVARETGVSESSLSHFLAGARGLSVEAINRLGEYLGLKLVKEKECK